MNETESQEFNVYLPPFIFKNWPSWISKSQKIRIALKLQYFKKYQLRHLHKTGQLCSKSIQIKLGLDNTAPGI